MSVVIEASACRTCFGDGDATFLALLDGRSGIARLRYVDSGKVNVRCGFHAEPRTEEETFRASRWLGECVAEALARSAVDPRRHRVRAIIATGLRELRAVERMALDSDAEFAADALHFGTVVRRAAPGIADVLTISNACSAGGYALALAQDLLDAGEADAVVVGGTDSMTASMLAMIGKVSETPTTAVRPFDTDRTGVLLGEGAVVLVVVRESLVGALARARLLATGLSCDAARETALDHDGICRAMREAFERGARDPSCVDLVVAHGTGTALNDPAEATALSEVFGAATPLVTALKGAVGHTSGGSALLSTEIAIRCMAAGMVPPVVGLRQALPEAAHLRLVAGRPVTASVRTAQVNSFGFGGVNAVTLLEAVA
ncbi:beta-ketoacyl synthase N-terminal-like domain-containing protein [Nocardia iowensis]|uniref:3-oxoacyl-ACP synthase n=1 Tax=Nocardia iowensis TaxID=204891 RepID=A0ABX8RGJ5_NOCIO|nr:beta-ketoacyl synthase N-terminal-like domain-containing protein [Nocardia iowensis]QXN88461.1 3-oxoacyl-ACP synthase [Nocardia iowensis]